jgi:hypothetical protein
VNEHETRCENALERHSVSALNRIQEFPSERTQFLLCLQVRRCAFLRGADQRDMSDQNEHRDGRTQ